MLRDIILQSHNSHLLNGDPPVDGENGSFTPFRFSTNGEMSTETKKFYRRLSQLLCEKSDVSYSDTSA